MKKKSTNEKKFALAAAKIATERHCSDIVVLDLTGMSPATDYFVIATGTSDRQMKTVADEISQAAREMNFQRFGRAGYEQARWILLDFINVVIHIFDSEYRDYYDLELLWGDAGTEIIDYVKTHDIDLIVAGSRGLSQMRGWFLGSVSRKLVHYSNCSVLIVKTEQTNQ